MLTVIRVEQSRRSRPGKVRYSPSEDEHFLPVRSHRDCQAAQAAQAARVCLIWNADATVPVTVHSAPCHGPGDGLGPQRRFAGEGPGRGGSSLGM